MCCTRLAQNTERKISPKIRCLRTIAQLCRAISSQLRHGSTIGKKSLNANISSIMSSQYGELQPTNGWAHFGSLGHRSKFQQVSRLGIVTAATSYQKPSKLCTMFGRLLGWCTIYTLSGALVPQRNFSTCKIHFASKSCVLLYWQRYCTALQQLSSAKQCGVVQGMELQNFRRGRHLYSAWRPSRWLSAHILVISY